MQNLIGIVGLLVASLIGLSVADSCIQCTSATDPRCVTAPQHMETLLCANSASETNGCYTRIIDGHTIRGCLADIGEMECRSSLYCLTCMNINNAIGCNNEQFPEVRLFCHQCHNDLNSTCANEMLARAEICFTFREDNECFIRRTLTSIQRGCVSDSENICGNREHCFFCDGHGCNSFNASHEQIPLAPSSAALTFSSIFVMIFMLMTAKISYYHNV